MRRSDFDIDIQKLGFEKETFEFIINNAFLDDFEVDLVEGVNCVAQLLISKTETLIDVIIEINGDVVLQSDRSLKTFSHSIDLKENVFFRFGKEYQELEDNLTILPEGQSILNLSQTIYELIVLAIPAKRLHPDEIKDEEDGEELVYSTDNEDQEVKGSDTASGVDPRWEKLKKLK